MTRIEFAADVDVGQAACDRRSPRRVLSLADRGAMLRNNVCAKAERRLVPYVYKKRKIQSNAPGDGRYA